MMRLIRWYLEDVAHRHIEVRTTEHGLEMKAVQFVGQEQLGNMRCIDPTLVASIRFNPEVYIDIKVCEMLTEIQQEMFKRYG